MNLEEAILALKTSSVTKIDLSHQNIGDEDAKALADALMKNKSIDTLDLSNNNIGDEGAKALAKALAEKPLVKCHLLNNKIGHELLTQIYALSARMTIIENLAEEKEKHPEQEQSTKMNELKNAMAKLIELSQTESNFQKDMLNLFQTWNNVVNQKELNDDDVSEFLQKIKKATNDTKNLNEKLKKETPEEQQKTGQHPRDTNSSESEEDDDIQPANKIQFYSHVLEEEVKELNQDQKDLDLAGKIQTYHQE